MILSDIGNERRAGEDGDRREQMGRLFAEVGSSAREVVRLRDVVHPLVSTVNALALSAEEAEVVRNEIMRKVDGLDVKLDATILGAARAEASLSSTYATLSATLAAHIETCNRDKAEIRQKHSEIQRKLSDMEARAAAVTEIMHQRISELTSEFRKIIYAGGGAMIVGLFGILGYLLASGTPWSHAGH